MGLGGEKMTTQYKWMPSEPTQEMLDAERFASSLAYESHEVQAVEVYKAMWQAAPTCEPLSSEEIVNIMRKESHLDETVEQAITLIKFARAIEKAHGIGVE
jgi:predicted CoA-binding protein